MAVLIAAQDKWKEADREVRLRRRVYPRWVEQGKLTALAANRQLAVMEAIAEDYRAEAEQEAAKERLI